jgi:SNF2 family DNA or RNA helicase
MRRASDLHGYQATAAGFLYDHPSSALFVDLGLGKTVITLTLLARLKREGWRGRALVIAPLRVANQVWHTEIAAWAHTKHLTYRHLTGPAKERLDALKKGRVDVSIINVEQVQWLVQQFVEARSSNKKPVLIKPWPFDVIIIDELSKLKDHSTGRFAALKMILPAVKRLHGLTATPAAEGYMGLFAQTYLLDRGERFGKHITHFREAYFDHNHYAKSYKLKPGAAERIEAKLADICLVMKASDYLPRQEPLVIDRVVTLTADQMKRYRDFERDFILELPDGTEIEAETAANLASKLLQMASGSVYDESKVAHPFHSHKTEELAELVEEAQGAPIIVAYWFQSSLARLQKAFPKAQTIDKKGKVIEAWNAKKVKMLLLHPQSAAFGLNLQAGGHIMAFFDMPWSLEMYLQTIGRIDRQGQTDVPRIYHLVAKGTDDELVAGRLREKQSVQEAFLARIKQLRKEMRRGLSLPRSTRLDA